MNGRVAMQQSVQKEGVTSCNTCSERAKCDHNPDNQNHPMQYVWGGAIVVILLLLIVMIVSNMPPGIATNLSPS